MGIQKILILLLSLISFQVFGGQYTIKKYDLNKNKKIDRTEYYDQEDKLVKVEIDKNNDGLIDHKIIYSDSEIYETHFYKLSKNGNFAKKVTFQIDSKNTKRIIKKTYLDKNDDGKFERNFKSSIKRDQQKDEHKCPRKNPSFGIESFTKDSLTALAESRNGFIPTGFGYDVDLQCVQKWGANFLTELKEAKEQGMKCLDKIHKDSGSENITGALENYFGLQKLQKDDQVKLVCSEEESYNWAGVMGHASSGEDGEIESLSVKHPFISINPNHPENKPATIKEKKELMSTIFHEGLHNLGHKHGHGYEYAYPCETCCFPEDSDEDNVVKSACKLCLGDYEDPVSQQYVEDIIDWSKQEYVEFLGASASVNFAKENPKSEDAVILLGAAHSNYFNPVGKEILDYAISKNTFSSPENIIKANILADSKNYKNDNEKKAAQAIAKAYYHIYYDQDAEAAAKALEENKVVLKEIVKRKKEDEDDYRADEITKALDDIIYEQWINNYPNETEQMSSRFYNLFKEILDDE